MHSIEIPTGDLSAAIERAALAYDARAGRYQPVLLFALISADAGAFSVTVTDLDREITAHAGGELNGEAVTLAAPALVVTTRLLIKALEIRAVDFWDDPLPALMREAARLLEKIDNA